MKKSKTVLFVTLLLFLFTTAYSQVIDEPYDFPIKPSTPEWNALSYTEQLKLLQIPDSILNKLSTKALIETCLNYPHFLNILAYDSRKDGAQYVIDNFNGLKELLLRQDAFTELFKKYQSIHLNMIVSVFEILYLETILFQDEILEKISYEEKMLLLEESYSKYKEALKYEEINGGMFNSQATLYLVVNLLLSINNSEITAEIMNIKDINYFLRTGLILTSEMNKGIETIVKNVLGIVIDEPTVSTKETIEIHTTYCLSQNYPNPFNPTTTIQYSIPKNGFVKLTVYDITGREVITLVNSYQDKGSYDVTFNARGLSSGIYFYKLNANGKQLINKMLLMK